MCIYVVRTGPCVLLIYRYYAAVLTGRITRRVRPFLGPDVSLSVCLFSTRFELEDKRRSKSTL